VKRHDFGVNNKDEKKKVHLLYFAVCLLEFYSFCDRKIIDFNTEMNNKSSLQQIILDSYKLYDEYDSVANESNKIRR